MWKQYINIYKDNHHGNIKVLSTELFMFVFCKCLCRRGGGGGGSGSKYVILAIFLKLTCITLLRHNTFCGVNLRTKSPPTFHYLENIHRWETVFRTLKFWDLGDIFFYIDEWGGSFPILWEIKIKWSHLANKTISSHLILTTLSQ